MDFSARYSRSLRGMTSCARRWRGRDCPRRFRWCGAQAPLHVEDVPLDPAEGDIGEQLRARFDPRQFRLTCGERRSCVVSLPRGVSGDRWLLLLLAHHLVLDHATLEILVEETQTYLLGREGKLPAPLPFRNFVAQARLGVSRVRPRSLLQGDVRRRERTNGAVWSFGCSGRWLRDCGIAAQISTRFLPGK